MNNTMSSDAPMSVIKRNGSSEPVQFDKVLQRIQKAAAGLSVNYTRLAQLVLAEIHDGVRTTDLDELAARIAISYMSTNPDWGTLAAQIIISNCQRSSPPLFSTAMEELATLTDAHGRSAPALAADVAAYIRENRDALNSLIVPANDFLLDYFGFKTLERSYLMRGIAGKTVETPQYMWLRVAVGMWSGAAGADTADRIAETYRYMSTKAFTHATPTLFNAGTPRPQLSSCFLISMKEDSVEGIFDTLKQCAQISKYAGGIGLHIHNIRAAGSHIAGTNGTSDGIMPMLRVFNNTARYINQGGRRNGSFAVYLEPWHADIQAFLKMKSNTGSEEERARDLFYALWIPDLFMRRVEAGGDWSLFCPHEAPGLADAYGPAFDALYERYEAAGLARRSIPAQKIWSDILVSQIETGTPYLLYKDAANLKSNQKNLGTIKSSNLCVTPETRITVYEPDTPPRQVQICDVVDQEVCVWNGERLAMVVPRKTATNQPILCVSVIQRPRGGGRGSGRSSSSSSSSDSSDSDSSSSSKDYKYLNCTPEHLFIMQSMSSFNDSPRRAAKDLRPGDRLRSWRTATGVYIDQEVTAVHALSYTSDTYCYTEEENHVGIFNGILTGQCTEIMEYSSPEETAVCNLASIALPYFLSSSSSSSSHFDFEKLRTVVAVVVRNLNRVIDINYYPTPETRRSNLRHRPVGIGIQGLADLFALLGLAWESSAAATLNRAIFENIYYAALDQSATEAEAAGPYETYAGSPLSAGILQPDLWGLSPDSYVTAATLDWAGLRGRLQRTGVRNSLLVAPMPTASTSQILGYNECIEPFTSNLYVRRTLAGEFTVVNRYLVSALQGLGLWSPELKERIVAANGSVQGIPEIPDAVKALYKTVWEIKQKTLIDMAADRGAFICQSQSLNLFVADPTIAKLSSMHFYAWKRGLKTGIYYLRTKSAVQAIKFTVDPALMKGGAGVATATETKEAEECLLCSS
jgi:ribonucleotide reductase alpha subunit